MKTTWFVCSDIHSFFDEWMVALNSNGFDINNKNHKLIVCGDLFDRGKQTVQCYELARKMLDENRMVYIRGNHESLMQDLLFEVKVGADIGMHHMSNGTLDSLAQFLNKTPYEVVCGVCENSEINEIYEFLNHFINTNCRDFYILGNFIFVHSWLPKVRDEDGNEIIDPNWMGARADWRHATWGNPFDEYMYGSGGIKGKTIVFGHWHTSYAHSTIEKDGSEFGADANFDIFKNDYIIGLDGCTAYTRKVNCLVIEENGDDYIIRQENPS